MTDITLDPMTGQIHTELPIPANDATRVEDSALYRITTALVDGKVSPETVVRDAFGDLRGRTATARLRNLAAALIEHADAADVFTRTYTEATYQSADPKPVEVFPGFPLTMTTSEHVNLKWPDGVRARDSEGDEWKYAAGVWKCGVTTTYRLGEERAAHDGQAAYLPASIIPTSWPTTDTNTEN